MHSLGLTARSIGRRCGRVAVRTDVAKHEVWMLACGVDATFVTCMRALVVRIDYRCEQTKPHQPHIHDRFVNVMRTEQE
jgi:hypothetical protein